MIFYDLYIWMDFVLVGEEVVNIVKELGCLDFKYKDSYIKKVKVFKKEVE